MQHGLRTYMVESKQENIMKVTFHCSKAIGSGTIYMHVVSSVLCNTVSSALTCTWLNRNKKNIMKTILHVSTSINGIIACHYLFPFRVSLRILLMEKRRRCCEMLLNLSKSSDYWFHSYNNSEIGFIHGHYWKYTSVELYSSFV